MEFDKLIHKFYNSLKSIKWQSFEKLDIVNCTGLDYYYAEDNLYIIRDYFMNQYYFVEARSPQQALDIFLSDLHDIQQ